jgi:hypothetical protein
VGKSKSVVLKCTCCEKDTKIAWGKEFYTTCSGEELPYGYPTPVDEVAKERGIHGFWVDKICKDCGKVVRESRYIEDVADEYAQAWVQFPKVDMIEVCSGCKGSSMMSFHDLVNKKDIKIPCPSCREGNLRVEKIVE